MPSTPDAKKADTRLLIKFMWLSVATAVATVAIKGIAAYITGSVGLMSDALESTVNLVAALVALWALGLSSKPADYNHDYGHGKAEYMSSMVEGALIFVAAAGIIIGAIDRFVHPQPIEQIGLGLGLSLFASLLNLGTGMVLITQGRKHRSITLEADGKHLMTDVVTSAGVLVAIFAIMLTHLQWLDPAIAIAVGINILFTGYSLIRRSVIGLLDAALPEAEVELIRTAINKEITDKPVRLKELRTRESGRQRFVQATLVVPAEWTVLRGHDLADKIEHVVEDVLPDTHSFIHIEPMAPAPQHTIGVHEPHADW